MKTKDGCKEEDRWKKEDGWNEDGQNNGRWINRR